MNEQNQSDCCYRIHWWQKSINTPLINNNNNNLKELILNFIKASSEGKTRQEINNYIYPKMNGDLVTKNNKVRTSLTYLRNKDLIENKGSDTKSVWVAK